jgi:hypothetical protein
MNLIMKINQSMTIILIKFNFKINIENTRLLTNDHNTKIIINYKFLYSQLNLFIFFTS